MPGSEPTYRKYLIIKHKVDGLSIREKRRLFKIVRERGENSGDHLSSSVVPSVSKETGKTTTPLNPNSFFPHFGITAGEFATWYVLGGTNRRH